MESLKVAVVGAGRFARKHLEVLRDLPGLEVTIASRTRARAEELAREFPGCAVHEDVERLLDSERPDAAFVVVSADQVARVGTRLLNRGIPTLQEKPPGLSVEECRELVDAWRVSQPPAMVGLNRRFYSVVRKAREIVDAAGGLTGIFAEGPERVAEMVALGHPEQVLAALRYANGIHVIDLLRHFGGEVLEVDSRVRPGKEKHEWRIEAMVEFQGGIAGHYRAYDDTPGRWHVELYAPGVHISLDPLERCVVKRRGKPEQVIEPDPTEAKYKPGLFRQDVLFIDSVRSGGPPAFPAADLEDALKTMEFIESIVEP